jgi:hypothetical protein
MELNLFNQPRTSGSHYTARTLKTRDKRLLNSRSKRIAKQKTVNELFLQSIRDREQRQQEATQALEAQRPKTPVNVASVLGAISM